MSTAETLLDTFVAPGRALDNAGRGRNAWPALAVAIAAALAFAGLLVPRADFERGARDALDRAPPDVAAKLTPHDVEQALEQARKLGGVTLYARAVAGPPLLALAVAGLLLAGFRLVGARPAFRPTFAVAAWGMLPLALRDLLALPAVLARHGIAPEEAARLLPASLLALAPGAPDRALPVLQALDLFALWAAALVALGMAGVAGTSRSRAALVVALLFMGYLAARFALPGLLGGLPGP